MTQWNIGNIFYTVFHVLLFGNPTTQWSRVLTWLARIITISLLLRTYIAPWLLALTSKHIRIRSISLRSIKGLYFSRGRWTCRVERIGYVFGTVNGRKRLTVRIDGLKIDMQKTTEEEEQAEILRRRPKHRRNLTLADLNPSPLAGHLWRVFTRVALALEPWLRPLIRNAVVACIRIMIQWLPVVTQALSFELHSTVFTLAQIPGTQVVADEINLHAELNLVQVENLIEDSGGLERQDGRKVESVASSWTFYGMAAWKKKMSDGLRRALDRAWGTMHGTVTLCFKLNDVAGTTHKQGQIGHESTRIFFRLPGTAALNGKLRFFPQTATIDANSITLGLTMDEVAVGVDLLNDILRVVVPPKSKTSLNVVKPITSLETPSPATPSNVVEEGAEVVASPPSSPPKRSRSSTIFSTNFLPVSPAASFRSLEGKLLLSPKASASPFLKAFSVRFLSESYGNYVLTNNLSILSVINKVTFQVSSVSLSFSSTTSNSIFYKTAIRNVHLDFHPSSASTDPLHAQWLGRTPKPEIFDPETYGLQFRITTIVFERHKRNDVFPLITLGTLDFQAVVYQWPSPWLMPCIFMRGDPNAPFLATSLKIGGVDLTDRLDDLRDFLERRVSKPKDMAPRQSLLEKLDDLQLPRCSMQMHCGAICARMICEKNDQQASSMLEMRTSGFIFGFNAEYDPHLAISHSLPLGAARLSGIATLSLDPVLCHVRPGWASVGSASDNEFLNDPPVLSIGAIDVGGDISAEAQEELDVYRIKKASVFCDVHTIIDTVCLELWHADSVLATVQLLAMLPARPQPAPDEGAVPAVSVPSGFAVSLTLARFIVVVTAPDINPEETDLSRGIGLRALISLEFCAFEAKPDSIPRDHKRLESRMLLGLSRERLVDAIVAASQSDSQPSAVATAARLSIQNLVVRCAVATQFESDDPFLSGKDDFTPTNDEFIRIKSVKADASLAASLDQEAPQNTCQVVVDIPSIRSNFQLGNIYCALLALQTIQNLTHIRCISRKESYKSPSALVHVSLECRIQAFNLLWSLPNQTVVSLLEDACFTLLPGQPIRSQFKSLAFWVSPPTMVNKWEHEPHQKWDELLTFHQWDISLPVVDQAISVATKGESLRLRIPHGYILADLILDLTVVAKAAKHLVHIVKSGMFTDMPSPEPEGPKLAPNMTFDIGSFCIEAIDDPFEAKLSAIWRVGLEAVKQRLEREEAFSAKLAAIQAAGDNSDVKVVVEGDHDYRFTAKHTVPVEDARRRLDEVHFLDWKFRLQNLRNSFSRQESIILHRLYGPQIRSGKAPFSKSKLLADSGAPPLFRLFIKSLNLVVSLPTFSLDKIPNFLHEQGGGLRRDTEFSLLIPLHVNFMLNSVRITIRDFPIPLLHVQRDSDSRVPAWTFDSDVVIAEEMGSDLSSDWIECPVLLANQGIYGTSPLSLHVPKTIMPVKTYACPNIDIATSCPTILSWGVSYTPSIQDVVRIIETLTPNPQDSSPPIGFWDKLRLIAHWKIKFSFRGEVRCYLKGSRDPVHIADSGTGFVLVWRGSPEWLIGYSNEQQELMQVTSDAMLIAIPRFSEPAPDGVLNLAQSSANPYRKICAELHSGVRYGIGFVFERTCDPTCPKCSGNVFQRQCRIFDFIPHYDVRLETKLNKPALKAANDSYRAFRSDFIHFSFSLSASTKMRSGIANALHLTPKAFTHFWTWCSLFDNIPTLPIRAGSYYVPRLITPKFGRHIATIKYRIILTRLFVMHGYMDDAHETWTDGITPWVGVKGMVDELRVDMHQRDQETKVRGVKPDETRTTYHKPFYAAEVVLKGVDLRTVLAVFEEPLKIEVPMAGSPLTRTYLKYNKLPRTPLSSSWYNIHDFVELDWTSSAEPILHCLPFATCPRFAYVKRNAAKIGNKLDNKFGIEDTHYCLLEQEPSIPQIQISLAIDRIDELKHSSVEGSSHNSSRSHQKMIGLLQDYIELLKSAESEAHQYHFKNYHMPSEVVLPEEWAEFDHVYQLHSPNLSLDKATRDIMIQYYHSSRERKGFEYHLAARAVKFIRDQAKAARVAPDADVKERRQNSVNTAQLAASALRKMLRGEGGKSSVEVEDQEHMGLQTDPLDGWSDGVTLRKAHCCFLLKPQVVLRDEDSGDVCVAAAIQAKLQSFAILDNANIDDPISGKIMSRNYTSLSGFQALAPVHDARPTRLRIPLEVLIDLRCESQQFERIVPQTDATFHYDKFNRLRLRNQVTSDLSVTSSADPVSSITHTHLQDQTDLIRIHIPHFTVSANDKHFRTISNIITKLLLFSDVTHKARLEKLETLLFNYDFTDLCQAAHVIVSLQGRLRASLETERTLENSTRHLSVEEDAKIARLRLRAHIISLTEELDYLFGAIKLAQDRTDERMDQKSALLVHASSSELSWRMLSEDKNLLAKLVIQHSNFYWLSRQDSAMVNDLAIGNLQAFDGSRDAIWMEILLKHNEPANHPLHKRNLFLVAHWSILPPVGGISIYETFEISLHPLKLQVDAKVGRRIMEYLLPDRRHRPQNNENSSSSDALEIPESMAINIRSPPLRSSIDSPRALQTLHPDSATGSRDMRLAGLRRLGASRSFTDLRSTREDHHRSHLLPSKSGSNGRSESPDTLCLISPRVKIDSTFVDEQKGDAAVMITRSSLKTFVFVKVASRLPIPHYHTEGSTPQHRERATFPDTAVDEGWTEIHHDDIVEHLDVIDPQVGTVSTLTNAANSIIIPPTPFYDRKPVISLPAQSQDINVAGGSTYGDVLDRHVDDVIKRPFPARRALLGVWTFLKTRTSMGIITGIYGFLVAFINSLSVFWGAAIVIFLTRIINFHNDNTQGFWVEVSSQVVNGLFTATSIGLIPSRIIDTYRICKIWHYKRKTIRLRKLAGIPQLFDRDDLPDPCYDDNYVRVLADEEQNDLHRQQLKLQYHQTWYRAHGTETHRAFPINIALAICFLNDGNSILQIILCGTMWGLNRFQRPAWSTATLIPASFLCGIGAAILIWRGGEKTKRVEEIGQRLRDALAELAPPVADTSESLVPHVPSRQVTGNSSPIDGPVLMEADNSSSEKLTSGDTNNMLLPSKGQKH
ncbi:UPF0648 protein C3H5.09c [Leucoagaricus sp. SymC.cos]|nr:UPF0648 protein C3H5.09c [Leucoagaricus sp. SymC.cos]